ncbi:MAG: hypothetical protein GC139_10700 [Sideroxydans sp.]|nr:hypothetical protein [Sideroxydans sp.]
MIQKHCRNSMVPSKRNGKMLMTGLAVMAGLAGASSSYAGQTFTDGEKSLSVGFGLRTSLTSLQNGAPNGTARSKTFDVENMRLYVSGQLNNMIKGTLNTERDATGKIVLMDGFTELGFSDTFNVRMGRLIPPTDRSNLDGPFYLNAWQFPGVVSAYPTLSIGRDNGILAWGKPMDGKIVYSVGAFTGHNVAAGGSNDGGSLLYAGRVAFNLLDAEPAPAYYTASTYYGSKDILTVALVYQTQKNAVGSSPALRGDYKSWSTDLLFEKKLAGDGVVTMEGAYYKYGLGTVDCGSGEPGAAACVAGNNVGGLVAGKAYLATAAYLFPQQVGVGKFQPFVRLQNFKRDVSQTTNKQSDIGVNYVMDGHNARISAVYSKLSDNRLAAALVNRNQFVLGYQFQF